jgi:hypothetical protein
MERIASRAAFNTHSLSNLRRPLRGISSRDKIRLSSFNRFSQIEVQSVWIDSGGFSTYASFQADSSASAKESEANL